MERVALDPDPEDALAVHDLDIPFEAEAAEDELPTFVQAIALEPIVSTERAKHASDQPAVEIVRPVADFDAASLEAGPKLVIELNDLVTGHVKNAPRHLRRGS
jgi:hypothetical protein